jgi:hypothetical protein
VLPVSVQKGGATRCPSLQVKAPSHPEEGAALAPSLVPGWARAIRVRGMLGPQCQQGPKMATCPSPDESLARLHKAGWSVGDACFLTARGMVWKVTGASGETRIKPDGATQAHAWHRACQQAEALGMLGSAGLLTEKPKRPSEEN